jgi:hypothetical protein
MKKVRRVTEPDVVAEFLRNEFYQEEFHRDRRHFERLVLEADTSNDIENAIRRALLFRRRGHMWRELPEDTQWWEILLELEDLPRIRVFPRAQWRRISDGSLLLSDIVHRIRSQEFNGKVRDFIAKVHSLSYQLRMERERTSVILIGVDESRPLTILEGNHRLAAACLASAQLLEERFRVLVGFSPRMFESCWYETNLSNLWRYAKNRIKNLYDHEADLERALATAPPLNSPVALAEAVPKASRSGAAETVR